MKSKTIVIGPGYSSLELKGKNLTDYNVVAFQGAFPSCLEFLKVKPDVWFCGDPYAYLEGFKVLLEDEGEEFKDLLIIIPDIFIGNFPKYRKYCGTTPLMRMDKGWEIFQTLIQKIKERYTTKILPTTTTKFIQKHTPKNSELRNIFSEEDFYRFMHNETIFGTVEFDSESVIADKYKWGLENKLTSVVLPICYTVKYHDLHIIGFDFQGPRFYSSVERHPWNDESQKSDTVVDFPLKMLEKWVKWKSIHRMNINSIIQEKESLLNKILEKKDIFCEF